MHNFSVLLYYYYIIIIIIIDIFLQFPVKKSPKRK